MLRRRSAAPHAARLVGSIDGIDEVSISGWAIDEAALDDIVDVAIVADGRQIGCGRADVFRPDLLAAGFGHGKHGFKVEVTDLSRPLVALSIVASSDRAHHDVALPLAPDLGARIARALLVRGRPAGLPDAVEHVFGQVQAGTFDGAGRDPALHEKIYLSDELFIGALLAHATPAASAS